jgi:hypothetical protein
MGESTASLAIDPPAGAALSLPTFGRLAQLSRSIPMSNELSGVIAEHIRAVNAFDVEAIVATFAKDAYVNDNRREIVGIDAIKRWVQKEIVGDHVTIDVREVVDRYDETVVRGAYDGEYDKTNLPKELILSNYFGVRDGKIVRLIVIFNQPSPF